MILTKLQYMRRFTSEERVAIRQAAKVETVLEDYLSMLASAEDIDTTDVDTVAAVNMLEQSGLLSVGRAEEILGSEPSPQEVIAPAVFVPTHLVDGFGLAMLSEDGTVRFENGRWSTVDALAAMGKTLEAL